MKKAMIAFILIACCFCFCGCVSKDDVIGVWKSGAEAAEEHYLYVYKDGTGDSYVYTYGPTGVDKDWNHVNQYTWKTSGKYFVEEGNFFGPYVNKYTISGNEMFNSQGKLAYTKVSNDPTKDIK